MAEQKPKQKNLNTSGLIPFKKGQSGNPQGGSKKLTTRRLLRDFLADALNEEMTAEQCAELELLQQRITAGEVIARGIRNRALKGNAKAIDQILSTEPRTHELGIAGVDSAGLIDAVASHTASIGAGESDPDVDTSADGGGV
tara:strand:- start:529 stop:954 length:426 start_codon:yes stop_codon:yes gene_type:complete